MKSEKKKDVGQNKSILSFFNTTCSVTESKKRTHTEMMRGENNDKFINLTLPEDKAPFTREKEIISRMKGSDESQDIDGIYVVTKRKKVANDEGGYDTPKFKKNSPHEVIDLSAEAKQDDFESLEIPIEVVKEKVNRNAKSNQIVKKSAINSGLKAEDLNNIRNNKNKSEVRKNSKMVDEESKDDDYSANESYNSFTTPDNKNKKAPKIDHARANSVQDAFSNPYNGLPEFLKGDNIRDKMGRRPDDLNYDPTTLLVPTSFLKSKECSPAMQQYWQFKMDNFDKVLLFKLGKFYEMFFDDAIVGNGVLDLKWMGNDPRKLHVGFPEKCLEEKSSKLIEAGFKVCVIEQTERPEEMLERIKDSAVKQKCVKRELCNVFTKGTYMNHNGTNLNYSNKYCISIVCNLQSASHHTSQVSNLKSQNSQLESNSDSKSPNRNSQGSSVHQWGYVIFDVTTLKFFIGQFTEDDDSFTKIMTLLYNVRPEEVILMRNNVPSYIINFITSLSTKPQITYLKSDYNVLVLNKICTKYFGEDIDAWQKTILNFVSEEDSHRNACAALYITATFLEKILLAEQCLSLGNFEEYIHLNEASFSKFGKKTMIIDYMAVSNLELCETKIDPKNCEAGSLLEYINRAASGFGKRLLRTWLLNPLCDVNEINERLDMVEDFINNPELLTMFRNALSKWPDIERQTSKMFKFAISNNSRAVYFEDVSKNRLQEFFNLVNFLKKSIEIFKLFESFSLKSEKLLQKVTVKSNSIQGINSSVPNIKEEVEHFSNDFLIRYEKDENNNNPIMFVEPVEGVSESYDACRNEISEIENLLDEILKKEKKRLKCAVITFAHTKFYKYELEIPEEYVIGDKRPSEYKLTTSKKGYLRFHTKEIIQLVERLEEVQLRLKEETKNLNIILFKQFYLKSGVINEYIKNISELDCLATLATVSSQSEGVMTRPTFITLEENVGVPCLFLTKSRHPCLSSRTHGFVANDISIGHNSKSSVVITGPNMGGKSTLLRQACVIVVMAQIGCYVPAEKCVMSVVDRIFTRIGARDKILEGKSTFYIEMEETKTIMSHATINSLVIMDELGRGTSTHDGNIIARTILDRLEKRIKCRTLFTTHYHTLKDWCLQQPGIDLFFMDCMVDEGSKDITFLYKFKNGVCPQSYGIHVAKLAGLPEEIVNMAAQIAERYRRSKSVLSDI